VEVEEGAEGEGEETGEGEGKSHQGPSLTI
jgi:hypothetical protein